MGRKLAILGGEPAFTQTLHVGRPNIGNKEKLLERIESMVDRRWLSNKGKYVKEFEKRVADFLGVKHCIAICNGTVALEIAIRALELKGEVIIPSFTFVATAHALQWQEITPVFCDIDPHTHRIDPRRVEELITPKTTGIMGVHLWGGPCDTDSLATIAQKHKLTLCYDAAHAFGVSHKGKMIGNFGEAEIFSFHATKFMNASEGGAVVTNSDELASKIRLMKNFGFSGYDNVIYIGTNGKMSEMSAAMGLTNLESIDEFISVNKRNHSCYKKALSDIPGLSLVDYPSSEKANYQYIVVEVDDEVTGVHRNDLVKVLHAENVIARSYFHPGCHNMEPYRSHFPHSHLLLPETKKLVERVLILPTGTAVSPEEIDGICSILSLAINNSKSVADAAKKL